MICPKCKKDVDMLKFTTTGTMCRDCHNLERTGTVAVAGAAICSAASSKEPERDESDCAPYWLCRGMAQYIVEIYDETCERAAVGGELCHNTSDCITEWCVPCAAKAWLEEQIRLEKPLPPNGAAHRQPPTTNKDKNAK
jgi:hypothetical protein